MANGEWVCTSFCTRVFFKSQLLTPTQNEGGGAGDETRTRDIFLGKEVLYQLSYTRVQRAGK